MNDHSCGDLLLGMWPILVETSGDYIFIDFCLDLTDFATTYEIMVIQNWRFLKIREFKNERIDKTTTGIILYDSYNVYDIHVKKDRYSLDLQRYFHMHVSCWCLDTLSM